MVRRVVVVTVLAVLAALAGCGEAQQSRTGGVAPGRPDSAPATRAVDPVLVAALAGQPPRAAADPRALARQITAGEAAGRDPVSPPELVTAGGWTAQVAYRALADRLDWDAAVLAEIPAPLHDAVRWNLAAVRELRAMVSPLPASLPAWRIVTPLPVPELRAYYGEAERRFGVPWQLLAAINLVETCMGRIVGLSSAGAQGPMQFMPATWARYGLGGDVWNTRDAILGAANYLAGNGAADGTEAGLDNALYRYNSDSRYVRGVRHYMALMQDDERAFLGLHAHQVYYRTYLGDILLPVGYESTRSIPVHEWLTRPR